MRKLLLMVLLVNSLTLNAQPPRIENLVFEGAGIRGIAYAGVVQALEKAEVLSGVKRVGGTSAGAITALLISLGYTPAEMTAIIGSTNFRQFNDNGFFFPGGLIRLNRHLGWYKAKRFEKWLGQIIAQKTGSDSLTFGELWARGFKALYVTGTNLSAQRAVVFSHESHPRMRVLDAVRISASIPLYFEPLWISDQGTVVRRPLHTQGLAPVVDGGFIANFPIHLFDSLRYGYLAAGGVNIHTLGFRIDQANQTEWDKAGKGLAPFGVNNLKTYLGAFYNLVIESLNRQQLSERDWQRTVSVSDGGMGPRIRKLKAAEINSLVEGGRNATLEYLRRAEPMAR